MTDNIPSEPSIEDVLKELKQSASQPGPAKKAEASVASDSELKNLKNVLQQADAQAGFSAPPADMKPEQPVLTDEETKKEPVFNENFLKLGKIIKDLKSQ